MWLLLTLPVVSAVCDCSNYKYCLDTCVGGWTKGWNDVSSSSTPLVDDSFTNCLVGNCTCPFAAYGASCGSLMAPGVVLGQGIDLFFSSSASLKAAGVSDTVIGKLSHFLGATNPQQTIKEFGWTLTAAEAVDVMAKVEAVYLADLQRKYNAARKSQTKAFESLQRGVRSVLFSVYASYGGDETQYKLFWKYTLDQDWTSAIAKLNNFGDSYQERRTIEALTLAATIRSCDSQGYSDVHIIVDESGSIGSDNFKKVITFLNTFVSSFQIGSQYTQVSLLLFDSTPDPKFNLNKYTDLSSILRVINSLYYRGGGTYTESALNYVYNNYFLPSNGARRREDGYGCVALVLTDGQCNSCPTLQSTAGKLQSVCTVLTVGIGSNIDTSELQTIASENRYVYMMSDFDALLQSILMMKQEVCYAPITVSTNSSVSTVIKPDGYKYFSFPVSSTEGTTVIISGSVIIYGSWTNPNPGELSYDFKAQRGGQSAIQFPAAPYGVKVGYFSLKGVTVIEVTVTIVFETGLRCDSSTVKVEGEDCSAPRSSITQCQNPKCGMFLYCPAYHPVANCESSYLSGHFPVSSSTYLSVDMSFMLCTRGQCPCTYLELDSSCKPLPNTGVMIGPGLNLLYYSSAPFLSAGISSSLVAKFQMYFGVNATAAYSNLGNIVLTYSETLELHDKFRLWALRDMERKFNAQVTSTPFASLPAGILTAMLSVYLTFGCDEANFPLVWDALIQLRLKVVIIEIRNLGLTTEAQAASASLRECNEKAAKVDLVLVIDDSGSISTADFEKVRSYLLDLTSKFTIGQNSTQVAILAFSSQVRVLTAFNSSQTYANVQRVLQSMDQTSGMTNTNLALDTVRTQLILPSSGARKKETGVNCMVLILTDGGSSNPALTKSAAAQLKSNCTVMAVGVGQANYDELNSTASAPRYVYNFTDYDTLIGNIASVTAEVCQTVVPAAVDTPIQTAIEPNSYSYFSFPVSSVGNTIQVDTDSGNVFVYVSWSDPNPNRFLCDFSAELKGKKTLRPSPPSGVSTGYFSLWNYQSVPVTASARVYESHLCPDGSLLEAGKTCEGVGVGSSSGHSGSEDTMTSFDGTVDDNSVPSAERTPSTLGIWSIVLGAGGNGILTVAFGFIAI